MLATETSHGRTSTPLIDYRGSAEILTQLFVRHRFTFCWWQEVSRCSRPGASVRINHHPVSFITARTNFLFLLWRHALGLERIIHLFGKRTASFEGALASAVPLSVRGKVASAPEGTRTSWQNRSPSAAKAITNYSSFTARLKPCPFKSVSS